MLNRFKIGTRMAGIMVMTVLGMALIAAFGLMSLKENRIEDRRAELQHLVQSARGIVEHYHQEVTAGRMKEPDAQSAALAALSNIEFGANDYVFVYQFDGTTRAVGKNKKGLGENRLGMVDSDGVPMIRKLIEAAQRGGGYVNYRFPRAGETVPNPKLSYAAGFAPWQWMVGTGVYIDDIEEAFRADLLEVGGMSLVLILLIGGGMVLVSFGITKPLAQITGAMGELASGNTAIEVHHTADKDEIGQLARALQTFKDNALEMERMRAEQEEAKRRAEAERRAMMLATADSFEASVKGVVETVSSSATEMRANAQSMATISDETSHQATAAAAAAEEASANVHTVAAAAERLNASIGEINRQIAESATVARSCSEQAETTGTVMRDLDAAAETIGNVVNLIEGIAGQVNLLALNATIEAARAGDAGKGFAVVAGEVKNLANQTATATQEIAAQVAAVQSRTKTAVDAIDGITSTIKRVNEISTAIASAVEEQGAATQEIARNVQEASTGTQEVTRNISGVTRSAAETGAASNQVLETAGRLSQESETLRRVVDTFIAQVRAG